MALGRQPSVDYMTEPSSIAIKGPSVTPAPRVVTTGELVLVLGLPTALFFLGSLASLIRSREPFFVTDGQLAGTLVVEVVLIASMLPYLRRRRWFPGEVAGAPEPRDLVRGLGVWVAAMVAYYIAFMLFHLVAPDQAQAVREQALTGSVSRLVAGAVIVLNPIFEEFLWLGYAVPSLSSRVGLRRACVISIALRVAVHAYQGPIAVVGILPMGLVFTAYYARTRRLWPLVVAHVIGDALPLATILVSRS
jgi:membrane protease YdiL (CAAX protease family)